MKFILFILVLVSIDFQGYSQDSTGIIFETGTWDEVVAIAKKKKKPIFVDAYTTWCGPCKWMAANTFTDMEVGTYINKNFVAYKMDMEKGEGVNFATKNGVNVYPTLLFFNKNGEMIHKGIGAKNPEQLIELSKNAVNPSEQISVFHRKYKAGKRDKAFLFDYINRCMDAGESIEEPFQVYWESIELDEKITLENLNVMRSITRGFGDPDHELFIFLNKYKKQFIEVVGEETFEPYWASAYGGIMWVSAKNEKQRNKKLKQAKSIFTDKKHEIDEFFNLNIAWQSKDSEKISAAVNAYAEVTDNWSFLNSQAWAIYEDSESDEELEKGLRWVNKSVSLNANYMNLDTKGAILYKLNRLDDAKVALEEAVSKIDESTQAQDLNTTEAMLREIVMALQEEED